MPQSYWKQKIGCYNLYLVKLWSIWRWPGYRYEYSLRPQKQPTSTPRTPPSMLYEKINKSTNALLPEGFPGALSLYILPTEDRSHNVRPNCYQGTD